MSPRRDKAGEQIARQRSLANLRERKRMMMINEGFKLLKSKLPFLNEHNSREKSCCANNKEGGSSRTSSSLTKVDILRLTIEYIGHLNNLLSNKFEQISTSIEFKFDQPKRTIFRHPFKTQRIRQRQQMNNLRRKEKLMNKTTESHEDGNKKRSNKELIIYGLKNANTIDHGDRRFLFYTISWSRDNDDDHGASSGNNLVESKLWIPEVKKLALAD